MESLSPLLVFVAVAESSGFTAASEQLGITKAAASLRVRQLEERLGVALFTRTTRRVLLTDAGHRLFDAAADPLRSLETALAGATASTALAGTLRLTAPTEHASTSLAPALARFAAAHPQLRIELQASDRVLDLVAGRIDIAVRLGHLRDSSERAVQLAPFQQWLVAAPSYLEAKGTPRHPSNLSEHAWISLSLLRTPLTWSFTHTRGDKVTVRVRSNMQVDSSVVLRQLLVEGAGISVLDHPAVLSLVEEGRLVRLLPRWSLPDGGIHAVFPPGRHVSAPARAFLESYRGELLRARR